MLIDGAALLENHFKYDGCFPLTADLCIQKECGRFIKIVWTLVWVHIIKTTIIYSAWNHLSDTKRLTIKETISQGI